MLAVSPCLAVSGGRYLPGFMSHEPRQLVNAATTLVALVAMTAAVSARPGPRVVEAELRTESHMVRVVAAAVAAVARDFAGTERCTAAVSVLAPSLVLEAGTRVNGTDAPAGAPPAMRLGARLLDLPPPRC